MKRSFLNLTLLFTLLVVAIAIAGCQSETTEQEQPANQPGPAITDRENEGEESETAQSDTSPFLTITFSSADDTQLTADVYAPHDKSNPFIVLCHQAGWSRGEYRDIAPKLNQLGFNCMAIDQRSGEAVNDVANETFAAATAAT